MPSSVQPVEHWFPGFQEEEHIGEEEQGCVKESAFHFCVYINRKKCKIMFKTLLKIPGMLFLLTLHENDNQRAFVVYSLF